METVEVVLILQLVFELIQAIFGVESKPVVWVLSAVATLVSLTGIASMVVAAVEKVTDVTPSTKDDKYVSTAKRWLGKVIAVLDLIALNPTKSKARLK